MGGIPNVMNTGRSGMVASKAAIATTGHNITNSTTEGYSRQRVQTKTENPHNSIGSQAVVGRGVLISRVERLNDDYLEKQIRNSGRDLANLEEKAVVLQQTEDIFNEMGGEGMNRLMAKFFNEFRKLANDPDSEAVRQSVRESAQAIVNDFNRLRKEVNEVQRHIDAKLEGQTREVNSLADEIKDLNIKIKAQVMGGAQPNDLLDQRDLALRKLGSYMDLSMHQDGEGNYVVNIKNVGPLVVGSQVERFSVHRSKADEQGKPENSLDIRTGATVTGNVTHQIKGGKIGALLEARDSTLSTIQQRLDELAFNVTTSVNEIHRQGFTRTGAQGVNFFKQLDTQDRASEYLSLSDEVKANVNNISSAAIPDSPGDNRIAHALAGLQHMRLMNEGKSSVDDYFNSIVSDVGVLAARNRNTMNQQKDISIQLGKMRDQISGVSLDEETANLLQYQHTFDASAKVIQIADDMLKTVLDLKR